MGKPPQFPICVLFSPTTTTREYPASISPCNHSHQHKQVPSSSKVLAKAMSNNSSFKERLKRFIGRGGRDSAKSKAQDGSPKYGALFSSANASQGIAQR